MQETNGKVANIGNYANVNIPANSMHVDSVCSRDCDVRTLSDYPRRAREERPLSGTSQFSRRFFAIPSAGNIFPSLLITRITYAR